MQAKSPLALHHVLTASILLSPSISQSQHHRWHPEPS
jgi:hypothetical protein